MTRWWNWWKKSEVPAIQWIENANHDCGWIRFDLVDETSLILVSIQNYGRDGIWHVYKNGAGFGEYMRKEEAIRKAEEIAAR